MKRVVVRYSVKPERLEAHESLVRGVFAELAKARPAGLAYQALRLDDGVSFVHVATITTADGANPLRSMASFQAFVRDIDDRLTSPSTTSSATALGDYRAEGGERAPGER